MRQEKIFSFILQFCACHHGHFPTIRAIGQACGITSTSIVSKYLSKLEHAGRLTRVDGLLCVSGSRWLPPIERN